MIEIVKQVTILVNSLPRAGGVHDALLTRELITGKVLRIPKCKIGAYVHGHLPITNDTDEPRTTEGLYIGLNNNGNGYWIFKLKTKQQILVPRVTEAPMHEYIIDAVNKMGEEEGEKDGI